MSDLQKTTTLLMFDGKAEEDMNFYISLFNNSGIISLNKYQAGEPGAEGTVKHAAFTLNGTQYMCIDSNVKQNFTFSPAMSIYVNCDTETEIDRLFGQLSKDGKVYMPLAPYPFSKKFAWVEDRYRASWQLGLKQ